MDSGAIRYRIVWPSPRNIHGETLSCVTAVVTATACETGVVAQENMLCHNTHSGIEHITCTSQDPNPTSPILQEFCATNLRSYNINASDSITRSGWRAVAHACKRRQTRKSRHSEVILESYPPPPIWSLWRAGKQDVRILHKSSAYCSRLEGKIRWNRNYDEIRITFNHLRSIMLLTYRPRFVSS